MRVNSTLDLWASMESADWPWLSFGPWQPPALLTLLFPDMSQVQEVVGRKKTQVTGNPKRTQIGTSWRGLESLRGLSRVHSKRDPGRLTLVTGVARSDRLGTRQTTGCGAHAPYTYTPYGNGSRAR